MDMRCICAQGDGNTGSAVSLPIKQTIRVCGCLSKYAPSSRLDSILFFDLEDLLDFLLRLLLFSFRLDLDFFS